MDDLDKILMEALGQAEGGDDSLTWAILRAEIDERIRWREGC